MALRSFQGVSPRIGNECFVDTSAQVIGDVELGDGASIWFNSVVRGDVNPIRIGARTNIQDLSMVHVLSGKFGTVIGEDVTVGHHVTLHGCTIGNRVLVGMGSTVLDGAVIGDDCMVGAGALVTPGTVVPAGSLVLGSPARVVRPLRDEEKAALVQSANNYVAYARTYRLESGG